MIAPFIYLDIILVFLLILIAELSLNWAALESLLITWRLVRHIHDRHISPFILYLYLNPLYSIRGGSTTRADPFTKRLSLVFFLKNPLYN